MDFYSLPNAGFHSRFSGKEAVPYVLSEAVSEFARCEMVLIDAAVPSPSVPAASSGDGFGPSVICVAALFKWFIFGTTLLARVPH